MMRNKSFAILMALFIAMGMLYACGGSSSSSGGGSKTTLSGTVAAGAPVAGYVTVTGAFGNFVSADIATDGSYSIDVATLEPPYIIYAEGTVGDESVKIYSAAVEPGGVNITPVTDFILRNALSGADLDAALADWENTSALVNAAVLDAAETMVQEQLAPILNAAGVSPDADLMSISFDADHTGMDLVLDVVTISVTDSIVTVVNNLTGDTFTDDLTISTDDADAVLTDDSAEAFTDAVAIETIWVALETIYSQPVPSPTAITAWITDYVAADFLDEGEDKAMLLALWPAGEEGPPQGMALSTYLIASITPPAGYVKAYKVGLVVEYMGMTEVMETVMAYNGTAWLWYGNQEWVGTQEAPMSVMNSQVSWDGAITNSGGLQFYVDDRGNYAFDNGVNAVVVNGPGVVNGVVLVHDVDQRSYHYVDWLIYLTDTEIDAIPANSVYTIKLCNEDAATLDQSATPYDDCTSVTGSVVYTHVNAMPPLKSTELTSAVFPILGAATSHDILDYDFTSPVTVSWTNPTTGGTRVERASISLSDGVGGWYEAREEDLSGVTSVSLDATSVGFTPTNGEIHLEGYDTYNRKVYVSWSINSMI